MVLAEVEVSSGIFERLGLQDPSDKDLANLYVGLYLVRRNHYEIKKQIEEIMGMHPLQRYLTFSFLSLGPLNLEYDNHESEEDRLHSILEGKILDRPTEWERLRGRTIGNAINDLFVLCRMSNSRVENPPSNILEVWGAKWIDRINPQPGVQS